MLCGRAKTIRNSATVIYGICAYKKYEQDAAISCKLSVFFSQNLFFHFFQCILKLNRISIMQRSETENLCCKHTCYHTAYCQ